MEKLNAKNKKILNIITRLLGIALFLFIAYNAIIYGIDVKKTGEATAYFRIPYYPFAYVIAFAFLFQGFTIFCDLVQTIKGGDNE